MSRAFRIRRLASWCTCAAFRLSAVRILAISAAAAGSSARSTAGGSINTGSSARSRAACSQLCRYPCRQLCRIPSLAGGLTTRFTRSSACWIQRTSRAHVYIAEMSRIEIVLDFKSLSISPESMNINSCVMFSTPK